MVEEGTFTSFGKGSLVIILPTTQLVVDFVQLIYEDTLNNFYFMHDQSHELTLIEDGASTYHSRYSNNWKQAYGIKTMN